ncbi:MAG: ArsR family transcriptional regulator [Candidatus Thorarchaeota archaeon]|nr:ArsR family transcriptional regulator [Candidatus Thorarchaeota archaeon]
MMDDSQITWRLEFHKALSNPVRLKIVDFLMQGEQCQCDIFPYIGLAQSTVSAYLAQLVRAGILRFRRDGTRKLYSIAGSEIKKAIKVIRSVSEKLT